MKIKQNKQEKKHYQLMFEELIKVVVRLEEAKIPGIDEKMGNQIVNTFYNLYHGLQDKASVINYIKDIEKPIFIRSKYVDM